MVEFGTVDAPHRTAHTNTMIPPNNVEIIKTLAGYRSNWWSVVVVVVVVVNVVVIVVGNKVVVLLQRRVDNVVSRRHWRSANTTI